MVEFQKILESFINLLAQTSGRDKTCRAIQYFTRYLITKYYEQYESIVSQRNEIKVKINKSESLSNSMSMTRKILRFGPSLNCIKQIYQNIDRLLKNNFSEDTQILILKTLSSFFLGTFYICDHYLWLLKVGIITKQTYKRKIQFLSALGWFLDCITNILKNAAILNIEKNKKNVKNLAIFDMVRVICDTPVAWSFMYPGSVNGKYVGLLGTVTSLMGIYQIWA